MLVEPRIGLIGTGQTVGIAHYHVLGIKADGRARIAAVYDTDQLRARAFLADHGLEDAVVCDSYEQLLELVDAVDICTPNFTHMNYVMGAIQADRAVFVEKPLALSSAESRLAVEALAGKKLFNMVGFVYRYSNLMNEVRKVVQNDIGRVYTYNASFGGFRLANPAIPVEWRMVRKFSGSGALGDFGSHLVDNASFIAGLTFETVIGMTSTMIGQRPANIDGQTTVENDDQAVFAAKTNDNVLGSFTVSRIGMDEINLVVSGEGGLVRASMAHPEKITFMPAPSGKYSGERVGLDVPPQKPFEGLFLNEMTAFIDGLLGLRDDTPDIAQGHYVVSLIDAVETASIDKQIKLEK